jgi:2,4-dienoyl-CoA reductase-like NADH-dependent reductase (Old Yellow Enzyme family)
MTKLFEPFPLATLTLPNRFVRSATWEGLAAPDGAVTPRLAELVAALARGGVGLIISSHAYVRPEGQAGPGQLGAYSEALVPGLAQMAAAAHAHGAKIVLQLAHAGALAATALTARPAWTVSGSEAAGAPPPHVMTAADIGELAAAFAAAAARARSAGFDGVQIHAAHGYLLSQFLSPRHNRRSDGYGGGIENRVRALCEVLAAVRGAVGRGFPVWMKMNGQDFVEGGLETAEALAAALTLEKEGLDALELSGGWAGSLRRSPARVGIASAEREAYHREEAEAFRKKLRLPLALVGGIRSFETAERLVADGLCDLVSMSRPFIREPDLVRRWQSGDLRPALCRSDNRCFQPARDGEGIYCVTAAREARKAPADG